VSQTDANPSERQLMRSASKITAYARSGESVRTAPRTRQTLFHGGNGVRRYAARCNPGCSADTIRLGNAGPPFPLSQATSTIMPSKTHRGPGPKKARRNGRREDQNELDLPDFWDGVVYSKPFLLYFQSLFLDAVTRQAPEVLQSLRKDVWERAKRNPDVPNPTLPSRDELLTRWNDEKLSKQFHLPAWVSRYAGVALNLWSADPAWLEAPGWPSVSRGWAWSNQLPEDEIAFCLPRLSWEICGEPWSKFEEKATAEFRLALNSYRKRVTSLALKYGFEKRPRKRSRDGRHSLVAFDYLALWQVCGWTSEKIAAEFDSDSVGVSLRAEGVMEQIHWAADAIELTLRRPSKPGRPRKKEI